MMREFGISFGSNEPEARDGIMEVVRRMKALKIDADDLGQIEIALAEAVNNVVEHAYAGRDDGEVRVQCNCDAESVSLTICDAGTPLPDGRLPDGHAADLSGPRDALPEGGFGWHLIRALTRDIRYDRRDGWNHLMLDFSIAGANPER